MWSACATQRHLQLKRRRRRSQHKAHLAWGDNHHLQHKERKIDKKTVKQWAHRLLDRFAKGLHRQLSSGFLRVQNKDIRNCWILGLLLRNKNNKGRTVRCFWHTLTFTCRGQAGCADVRELDDERKNRLTCFRWRRREWWRRWRQPNTYAKRRTKKNPVKPHEETHALGGGPAGGSGGVVSPA